MKQESEDGRRMTEDGGKKIHHRDAEYTELNTFFPAGRLRPGKINYPALLEIRVMTYTHRAWSF